MMMKIKKTEINFKMKVIPASDLIISQSQSSLVSFGLLFILLRKFCFKMFVKQNFSIQIYKQIKNCKIIQSYICKYVYRIIAITHRILLRCLFFSIFFMWKIVVKVLNNTLNVIIQELYLKYYKTHTHTHTQRFSLPACSQS